MNLQKYYITEDLFPQFFTVHVEKDYGILFFNENNKDSYDSNHAVKIKKDLRCAGYKSWGEEHRYMLPLEKNAIKENEEVIVKCVDTWIDDIETVFVEARLSFSYARV